MLTLTNMQTGIPIWSPETQATFAALLLAHLLADFVFQTDNMVARKRAPHVFALHVLIVFGTTSVALGGGVILAGLVALTHGLIDLVKTYGLPKRHAKSLAAYLGDQAAHVLSLVAFALLAPGSFAGGMWGPLAVTDLMLLISGLLMASLAGGPAIGLLMARVGQGFETALPKGLPQAGRMIGVLERALIYILVLAGEPAGIGFLIAAKSILRFDTASKDQSASEYVIVGTLASFGWAFVAALATQALLGA